MMFGQQPYVYQQPIYNQPIGQPISQPMREPMMRPQYQPAPQMPAYQPQPQQPQNQSIIWIPNEQAANDFIVAPNNAVTLWDMNAPIVYVKKADASGKPTMTTYDLVERTGRYNAHSGAKRHDGGIRDAKGVRRACGEAGLSKRQTGEKDKGG